MMRSVEQKNGEAGSALVEFALASVIILTVLFGIIDMGRALYAYDWVSDAARRGTRYAMVRGTSCSALLPGLKWAQTRATMEPVKLTLSLISTVKRLESITSELTVWARCDVGAEVFGYLPCAPGQRDHRPCDLYIFIRFAVRSPYLEHEQRFDKDSLTIERGDHRTGCDFRIEIAALQPRLAGIFVLTPHNSAKPKIPRREEPAKQEVRNGQR